MQNTSLCTLFTGFCESLNCWCLCCELQAEGLFPLYVVVLKFSQVWIAAFYILLFMPDNTVFAVLLPTAAMRAVVHASLSICTPLSPCLFTEHLVFCKWFTKTGRSVTGPGGGSINDSSRAVEVQQTLYSPVWTKVWLLQLGTVIQTQDKPQQNFFLGGGAH